MAYNKTAKTEETKPAINKDGRPDYIVYTVAEGKKEGDKGFWTRIGAAWFHKDNNGLNIQLSAFPIDGKLTLRQPADD